MIFAEEVCKTNKPVFLGMNLASAHHLGIPCDNLDDFEDTFGDHWEVIWKLVGHDFDSFTHIFKTDLHNYIKRTSNTS